MAADFDGFAVLAAMAAAPALFESGRADAAKAARAIAVKRIKAAGLPLSDLRAIRSALGTDAYAHVLDGMKDTEIAALIKRLDAHNVAVKSMPSGEGRHHLAALSDALAPAERQAPVKRASTPRVAKSSATSKAGPRKGAARREADGGRTLTSEAMAARSPRRKGAKT